MIVLFYFETALDISTGDNLYEMSNVQSQVIGYQWHQEEEQTNHERQNTSHWPKAEHLAQKKNRERERETERGRDNRNASQEPLITKTCLYNFDPLKPTFI